MTKLEAITLFVDDPQRSKEFYARAFASDVLFEDDDSVVFRLDGPLLNLLRRGAPVAELLGPVEPADATATLVFTLGVDDVDAACAELAQRGIEIVHGPLDRPWGIRSANFRDPDGYVWELAAPLG